MYIYIYIKYICIYIYIYACILNVYIYIYLCILHVSILSFSYMHISVLARAGVEQHIVWCSFVCFAAVVMGISKKNRCMRRTRF